MSSLNALLIISLVSIGTYGLRVSGLLLSNKFEKKGKMKIFLDFLPSTLLLSLIIPTIIKEGIFGLLATCCIVLCMYRTKNILLSMGLGVLIIALSRNFSF